MPSRVSCSRLLPRLPTRAALQPPTLELPGSASSRRRELAGAWIAIGVRTMSMIRTNTRHGTCEPQYARTEARLSLLSLAHRRASRLGDWVRPEGCLRSTPSGGSGSRFGGMQYDRTLGAPASEVIHRPRAEVHTGGEYLVFPSAQIPSPSAVLPLTEEGARTTVTTRMRASAALEGFPSLVPAATMEAVAARGQLREHHSVRPEVSGWRAGVMVDLAPDGLREMRELGARGMGR